MNTNNANILRKPAAAKPIHSISPFTLLDYPGHLACIVWFAGCNMRCSYCYNPDLVLGKGKLSYKDALNFLKSRSKYLDGVVLSGGECTLHAGLEDFLVQVKELGYLVKIDTNGSRPKCLSALLEKKLVNRVAVDYKAPENRFQALTEFNGHDLFLQTLSVLTISNVPFEVRTTWHPELLNTKDLQLMGQTLKEHGYTGKFYVQEYKKNVPTLGSVPDPIWSAERQELEMLLPDMEFRSTN